MECRMDESGMKVDREDPPATPAARSLFFRSMRPRPQLLTLALAFACSTPAASINLTYTAVPMDAQAAIDHAASVWAGILTSPVPIKVNVTFFPMFGVALGVTFPNGERDFANAPLAATWHASALANSLAGTELNPGESDMDIFLDSGTDWYTGTDGNPGPGQLDLVSVALHEMGHGLGFVGLSKAVNGQGSIGELEMADFAPLATSFPWPDLDGLPSIFDAFLSDAQDGPLSQMPNPGPELAEAMTGNDLYFNGPQVMAINGGIGARIYAPATFALGSSCVHLDEASYPPSDPNTLMTPFSAAMEVSHEPGPITLAVLQDIGWNLAPDAGMAMHHAVLARAPWPNPTRGPVHFQLPDGMPSMPFVINDALGHPEMSGRSNGVIDAGGLVAGIHVLCFPGSGQRYLLIKV